MSLRWRILSLVFAASLLPVLFMVWALLDNHAATIQQARETLSAQADLAASSLDDKVSATAQLLFGLARVPLVGAEDARACSIFLAEVLKEHPQYTGLLTILPDGQLHCDSLMSGRNLDLRDRAYFRRALGAHAHVVEPVIGRLTGKGVMQIAYPVRNTAGMLRFVLLASLDLDAFIRAEAAVFSHPETNIQIWSDDGSVIVEQARPGVERRPISREEKAFVLMPDRRRAESLASGAETRIWSSANLPRTADAGTRVVLSVPSQVLHERVDRQFKRALAGVVLVSMAVFVAAALLGEYAVRRQTVRLMQAISRMDDGEFARPIGPPYPRGELGGVMAALDRMASSLLKQRLVIAQHTDTLERQANFDPLTELANRNLLTDRLDQALAHARRTGHVVGVLVLDLDRFKTVNDTLGHSQGDRLLQEVAGRLTACLRQSDTVARLGGDEFVLVLTDMAHVDDIGPVAVKVLAALRRSVHLAGHELPVSTSLGISVFPCDGDTAEVLLRQADTAMYHAKASGGDTLSYFTPDMNQALVERLRVEAGLRRALTLSEFRLHFQPIVDLSSGRIVGAEALLRWQDPERGLVSPDRFIPLAEETGLIVPIGLWVLREACRQVQVWRNQGLGDVTVAVNLSARQFADPALEASVADALSAANCPASLLQLEITESMLVGRAEQALETMHRIKALGVEMSIDDFGTGYSSLSYLKRFPACSLKIDRSFVMDIHVDSNDEAIVDAILMLAKKLGLRTIAEGVETPEQLEFLSALGCDEYQGYLFARPCTSVDFADLLRQNRSAQAVDVLHRAVPLPASAEADG